MTYTLPDLDYDYGALAPHIAPEIMELHHSKHHAAYVAGANTALEQLAAAREKGEFGAIPKLEKDLAFHLGGHINHSVFWKNMSPDGGGEPDGDVAAAIDEFFGSFDGFKGQFNAAANSIQGSGWSMLVWDTLGQRLNINQLFDQQGNLPVGQLPILQLDMWEHAFYLQYKNVKGDYVTAWWN
ncbi:MAG TPA: superoxide dismutase, partial [Arachnia sp.]|nr:superoxide dismutase [Arachnia sp.]